MKRLLYGVACASLLGCEAIPVDPPGSSTGKWRGESTRWSFEMDANEFNGVITATARLSDREATPEWSASYSAMGGRRGQRGDSLKLHLSVATQGAKEGVLDAFYVSDTRLRARLRFGTDAPIAMDITKQ
jgi:hypothetical protein